jgi:hypothetical protein
MQIFRENYTFRSEGWGELLIGRTLIFVPRMFRRGEFKRLVGFIPNDFEEASKEFWDYIEEKLTPFMRKIGRVYCEDLAEDGAKKIGEGEKIILDKLAEAGAEIKVVEDPVLTAETDAWRRMMEEKPSRIVLELYEESVRERDDGIESLINESLKDGETGLLSIDSSIKISFPADVRVVRMCPFDPQDYLNRHLTKVRLGKE